ncbi:hypothetical protein PROFUN_02659 [Planoprotostelium fungivorum]|uniref:Uncharacterized protein n=1 Tax=Planoprotostelium fungivorum TaxID=1890364 RepID=A0A2P6NVC5_9EUKA|nr:hypothetical protein PROFUN_02659 [Planoprotostelium fungivorum]
MQAIRVCLLLSIVPVVLAGSGASNDVMGLKILIFIFCLIFGCIRRHRLRHQYQVYTNDPCISSYGSNQGQCSTSTTVVYTETGPQTYNYPPQPYSYPAQQPAPYSPYGQPSQAHAAAVPPQFQSNEPAYRAPTSFAPSAPTAGPSTLMCFLTHFESRSTGPLMATPSIPRLPVRRKESPYHRCRSNLAVLTRKHFQEMRKQARKASEMQTSNMRTVLLLMIPRLVLGQGLPEGIPLAAVIVPCVVVGLGFLVVCGCIIAKCCCYGIALGAAATGGLNGGEALYRPDQQPQPAYEPNTLTA